MRGLGGTGLLERNRAAFERAMRTKAEHAARDKRGREDVLAQTKRVERSSVFVPHAANTGCAPALCSPCAQAHTSSCCKPSTEHCSTEYERARRDCAEHLARASCTDRSQSQAHSAPKLACGHRSAAAAPRRAHENFRHTAVYRDLFDTPLPSISAAGSRAASGRHASGSSNRPSSAPHRAVAPAGLEPRPPTPLQTLEQRMLRYLDAAAPVTGGAAAQPAQAVPDAPHPSSPDRQSKHASASKADMTTKHLHEIELKSRLRVWASRGGRPRVFRAGARVADASRSPPAQQRRVASPQRAPSHGGEQAGTVQLEPTNVDAVASANEGFGVKRAEGAVQQQQQQQRASMRLQHGKIAAVAGSVPNVDKA